MNRVFESSRREALFTAVLWIACCVYTVGYAALFAYRRGEPPELLFGIPSWVVWGVLAPWGVSTAITCWYALCGIRDEDLEPEHSPEAERAHD